MITLTNANRFTCLIAASLFGLSVSSLAALPAAAESLEAPKVTVKFADLDISHPQGAAVLYARIVAAAHKVCSPLDARGLSGKIRLDACIKNATTDAVIAVDEPALLAH